MICAGGKASVSEKILLHVVIVPLNVHIALPALASILVKLAKTVQLAPLFKVSIARFVAWSLVNVTIAPVLDVEAVKAVVTV
jgi:hypothetical protein